MKLRCKKLRARRRARLIRLENPELGRWPAFETLEARRMLRTVQSQTNADGTVYTLTDATSGGWLEMNAAGSGVIQVIDTNVSRFALDASGAAVAQEQAGNLALFPANSASRDPMLSGVRNFVIDGNGVVTALQAAGGAQWGTLYRFAPGSATAQEYRNEEFASLVSALGVSIALAFDGTLRAFPDDSNSAVELVNGGSVSNFVVDGSGSLVALVKPSSSSPSGTLWRWRAPGEAPTAIGGSYQALALDGEGDVVALDGGDSTHHLGTVWLFAPGSDNGQQLGVANNSTFLIDGSGAVWTFSKFTSTDWLADAFVSGSNQPKTITLVANGTVLLKQFELDGAGSVVALDANDNLVRLAPTGPTSEQEKQMHPGVTSFVIDGAGYVVADAGGDMVQFAPGSYSSVPLDSGVTSMALDGTGAVIALNAARDLDSFAPGATTGTLLDYNARAFELDENGQVVALEGSGNLILFYPGSSPHSYGNAVLIPATFSSKSPGWAVESFHIDTNGYIIAVETYTSTTGGLMNVPAPYEIAYVRPVPGQTPHYVTFQFAALNFNNHTVTAVQTQNVSQVYLLADGSMLVTIRDTYTPPSNYPNNLELPPQGPSEYFVVEPGQYSNNLASSKLITNFSQTAYWIDGVNVTIDGNTTPWVPTEPTLATEYGTGYTVNLVQEAPQSGILGALESIGLFVVGIGLAILSDGLLAPVIEDGAGALGLGDGAAGFVGSVVAGAVADSADQGLNIALNGGKFNWLEALTAGAVDAAGEDLLDVSHQPLATQAVEDGVEEEVTNLVTDLLPGGSGDSGAKQAAQTANAFVGNVKSDLQMSTVSSTFLSDATSFLNDAPSTASNLSFLNSALSFLNGAVGGNWNDPTFASFARSGASLLEAIASQSLSDTAFATCASSLLNQVIAGGLADSEFAQGALLLLEDALANQTTNASLVTGLGSFLNNDGQMNLDSFSSTTFGAGLGAFLAQAVPGGLASSALAVGLGAFLQQIAANPASDTSTFATGLGDLLNMSGARLAELTTFNIHQFGESPLITGVGEFLQKAQAAGLDVSTSPLAVGLGDYLEQATTGFASFTNGTFSDDLGTFVQKSLQGGPALLNSAFGNAVGQLLQQAAQDGPAFSDPTASGQLGNFLRQAAEAGTMFSNSTLGSDAGFFLVQSAKNGADYLNSNFVGSVSSFLADATNDTYSLQAATSTQTVLGTFLRQTSKAGAVYANSSTGAAAAKFLQQSATSNTDFLDANFINTLQSLLPSAGTTNGSGGGGSGGGNGSTPQEHYVTAVYQDVLDRAPDAVGLAFWTQRIASGVQISSIAESIAHSDEYYANFVIRPAYEKLLGRAADDAGVKHWTSLMDAGTTDQQLEADLASSNEFFRSAGGTNTAWIDAVYNLLLGRTADAAGEAFWNTQLAAGETRNQVAQGIAGSQENNTQLIDNDYFHYLGREADPDGLAFWLKQFAAGKTNEDVIAGFTGSDEYYKAHTD